MPRSDFLPFATGAGANVMSQTDFANDPSTSAGYSAGIAQSSKVNKVWRQSSFVGAAIAQFIMNELGVDVLDNGVLSDFVNNYRSAMTALQAREVLWSDTNFYVNSSTGNNSNDGRSQNEAWQTLQYASNYLIDAVDFNGYLVTVNVADGTYAGVNVTSTPIGCNQGVESLRFIGNPGNPQNVIVSGANTPAFIFQQGVHATLQGMTLRSPTEVGNVYGGGIGMAVLAGASIRVINNIFDACVLRHMHAVDSGTIWVAGNYTIASGAQQHVYTENGGRIYFGPWLGGSIPVSSITVTLIGTPNFSSAFAYSTLQSSIGSHGSGYVTFSGAATGKRYHVERQAIIDGGGAGITHYPGDTAGTVDATTYGLYLP